MTVTCRVSCTRAVIAWRSATASSRCRCGDALIVIFDADVSRLIQLYIVGVFVSFTMSQIGMVQHWTRIPRDRARPCRATQMWRSRVINFIGLILTGSVLIVVLLTKFTRGAYLAVIAMASCSS